MSFALLRWWRLHILQTSVVHLHQHLRAFLSGYAVLAHLQGHEAFTDSICELDGAVLVSFAVAVLDEVSQLVDRLVVEAVAHEVDVECLFAGGHIRHGANRSGGGQKTLAGNLVLSLS